VNELLHPGEALSDLLDGRLSPDEAERIRAHLLVCPECAHELAAVRDARAALRSLPAVELPPQFLERLLDDDDVVVPFVRRPRVLGRAATAVAAGLILVVGVGGHPAPAVSAEVNGAVQTHAATVSAISAQLGGPDPIMAPGEVTPSTLPHRSTDVPRPYLAPKQLGDYHLAEAFRSPHGVHLLYERGEYGLSVFEQEGDVDFDRLPLPGQRLRIAGDEAWRWTGPRAAGRVLVLERDGVVITIVGDESQDAVLSAAEALPDGARAVTLEKRLRRACGDALDALSPAG
jgi:hypothetical protein